MDTYSHLIRAASFGDFAVGELSYGKNLGAAVGDHSVTIFDRAYYSAAFLLDWEQGGIEQGLLKGELPRSKQPELIRQELWGTLLAYNLIRQEMRLMAEALKAPPQRLSFQWLALAIAGALPHCPRQTPGPIPQRLAEPRVQAKHFLLPARRERSYPRGGEPRRSKYPTKKCQSA
ncbi:hypothetical protein [Pseudomonas sp. 2FE]|uniref:hypothetical protein n=1 Tax=Pseudomonas sp. 2FE TaxID=2502190 RepID=UPI0010F79389|nr:hypothetical protein [Pseudomonas sp. 2FE]